MSKDQAMLGITEFAPVHHKPNSKDTKIRVKKAPVPTDFMENGACKEGPVEIFFSDKPHEISTAKTKCGICEVTEECLTFAIQNNEEGIWGGTTERERRIIKRRLYYKKVSA